MLQGFLAYKSFTEHKSASVSFGTKYCLHQLRLQNLDENDTKQTKKYSKLSTEDPSVVETKSGKEKHSPKEAHPGAKAVSKEQPIVAVTDVMLREKVNSI